MRSFSKERNCIFCSRKHKLFNYLTEDELGRINNARIEIKYKPNETIVKEGTVVTQFITFNRGLVKMGMEGKDKNIIIQYLKPPDFFLGPGVFTDRRNHYTLTAVEETYACLIDLKIFLEILPANKEFMYEFIKYQCNKELFISERLMTLTQKQMHGRIANALIYLNDEVYYEDSAKITILKADLANFASMNRDSVGRILKEFHEGGIIKLDNNDVEIMDMNILKQISEYG